MVLLAGCSSGEAEPGASKPPARASPQPVPAVEDCPRLPPPAAIPKRFPDIPLPRQAVSIEPAAKLRDGGIRIDLFARMTVRQAQRFFLAALRDAGIPVLGSDYEGFEAEVFFGIGRAAVVIRILAWCDETVIMSVEVFP